ncbi:cell division protein ZapA [Lacibacterium aquatile]|uniref:Cell division protein ZapA n=1 Tax=Lacibacterium aquatile TaxID=1168082 RepID=A0ABW5DR54_9PROT
MPELDVLVNGRNYRVACGPGEEDRLLRLAADLDRRVQGLVRSFGQAGEGQLLLVAALLLADELDEAKGAVKQIAGLDERASESLNQLADRIEQLAESLEHA